MGLLDRLRRHVPSAEAVRANRWVRWLGPSLHHPRLWHASRRGIALGVGLGVFFGLLIPVAQFLFAISTAILLRANVPTAVASTLVTNPVTFGPVYFAAYKTGQLVLRPFEPPAAADAATAPDASAPTAPADAPERSWGERLAATWDWLTDAGKPLVVGLALFACLGGLLAYALTSLVWAWQVRRNRARRLAGRGRPAVVDSSR